MPKKKAEIAENPDGLTEEEQAVEAEMMEDTAEVVAEEETQGDEVLSTEEAPPEEKAEEKAEDPPEEPEKPEPTTVPLAALDSERHKRREAERREAVLEGQLAALQAPKVEEEVPKEMPDPVIDPDGFKIWLSKYQAEAAKPMVQVTAQMRQNQEQAELKQFAATSEATFSAENGDYSEALIFARDLKAKEFRMWGYPEDQIPGLVNYSEGQVAALARERGVNPAQIVYSYAKMHGYKAKVENAGDKIDRLADVQKKTKSTSGAGGSAREEEWTAERIAGLSDDEMAALPDDVFRRVMGE